jgi:hypothetical protein
MLRSFETIETFSLNLKNAVTVFLAKLVAHPERAHARQSGLTISTRRIVEDLRLTFGNRGQHGVTVRNRFVTGNSDDAVNAACG